MVTITASFANLYLPKYVIACVFSSYASKAPFAKESRHAVVKKGNTPIYGFLIVFIKGYGLAPGDSTK